jgi:hypothetical protein
MNTRLIGAILLASLALGCASLAAREKPPASSASYNARFYGDKVTVKISAGPREVEEYLLDGKHLILWSVLDNPRIVGNDRFAKRGDTMRVEGRMFGVPIWFEMILVERRPGEELQYMYKLSTGGMGFLRLRLEPMAGGTRITKQAGNQMSSPLLGDILDSLKFQDRAVRSSEKAVADMQVYFDPSLTVEGLLFGGARGEVYDMFFSGYQSRVWINATPEKIREFLATPANWEFLRGQVDTDFGCLVSGSERSCPARVSLFGTQYPFELFPLFSQNGSFESAYLITEGFISRLQILVRPARGGTELRFDYLTEVPAPDTPETTNFVANMRQLPAVLETILMGVKAAAEAAARGKSG